MTGNFCFVAYLCCQLRRWIALLVVAFCSGSRSLSFDTVSMQWQFGLLPLLSYVFDYLTQVCTGALAKSSPVVMEFMYFVCSAAYLVFVLRITTEKKLRNQLEQTQDNLNLQVVQAMREIELLRESQQQAATYRHDLRHHMQYVLACIENERGEHARQYIQGISWNLMQAISAFAGRAADSNIPMEIQADISAVIPVSESDLCVLLSNGLENALHACQYSCQEDVTFEQGIPVTKRMGHGMGVRYANFNIKCRFMSFWVRFM